MRITCSQCQLRYEPHHVPFVPPVYHNHFCSMDCRERWVEVWEFCYGRCSLPDRPDAEEELLELEREDNGSDL